VGNTKQEFAGVQCPFSGKRLVVKHVLGMWIEWGLEEFFGGGVRVVFPGCGRWK
jgi:hypothetical protein